MPRFRVSWIVSLTVTRTWCTAFHHAARPSPSAKTDRSTAGFFTVCEYFGYYVAAKESCTVTFSLLVPQENMLKTPCGKKILTSDLMIPITTVHTTHHTQAFQRTNTTTTHARTLYITINTPLDLRTEKRRTSTSTATSENNISSGPSLLTNMTVLNGLTWHRHAHKNTPSNQLFGRTEEMRTSGRKKRSYCSPSYSKTKLSWTAILWQRQRWPFITEKFTSGVKNHSQTLRYFCLFSYCLVKVGGAQVPNMSCRRVRNSGTILIIFSSSFLSFSSSKCI